MSSQVSGEIRNKHYQFKINWFITGSKLLQYVNQSRYADQHASELKLVSHHREPSPLSPTQIHRSRATLQTHKSKSKLDGLNR